MHFVHDPRFSRKRIVTARALYRLITTAGACSEVWHAIIFPVPGVVRRRGRAGSRPAPCSPLPALRTCSPVPLLWNTPENRKMVIRRTGILEKFNRPRPDWPVFSEEFDQWAPAGIPEKTRKSVEPLAGRDGRGCGMARKGACFESLFHATCRNVAAPSPAMLGTALGEAPTVRGVFGWTGPYRCPAAAVDRSALPRFTHAPRSRLLAPCSPLPPSYTVRPVF